LRGIKLKILYRTLAVILVLVVVGLLTLGLVLQHDSPCYSAPAARAAGPSMQAVVRRCYGSADELRIEEVAKPQPRDNEILVKVRAASVNPLDWHIMHGTPYIVRLDAGVGKPKDIRLGVDFSGTVEAVGRDVTQFKPGDAVFGGHDGAFAEYVAMRADRSVVPKPDNMSFEQAAAAPIAGLTALQALRDKGHIRAGEKVLINGASGGVGTFAVQIAKSYGAEVTGVCSTKTLAMVRSLGADHVIDYTAEDFTQLPQRYDLILDTVGSHSLLQYRRVLTPHGILVVVGGPSTGLFIGPLVTPIKALLLTPFVSQRFEPLLAEFNPEDLRTLGQLMQSGKLTPVIDRQYPLAETPDAMRYVEAGHAHGKVLLNVP
jgi:NADPH:quinone reductase-like Zn-dependent oxidoreductase